MINLLLEYFRGFGLPPLQLPNTQNKESQTKNISEREWALAERKGKKKKKKKKKKHLVLFLFPKVKKGPKEKMTLHLTSKLGTKGSKTTWRECRSLACSTCLSNSNAQNKNLSPRIRRPNPDPTIRPRDALPGILFIFFFILVLLSVEL